MDYSKYERTQPENQTLMLRNPRAVREIPFTPPWHASSARKTTLFEETDSNASMKFIPTTYNWIYLFFQEIEDRIWKQMALFEYRSCVHGAGPALEAGGRQGFLCEGIDTNWS